MNQSNIYSKGDRSQGEQIYDEEAITKIQQQRVKDGLQF